MIQTKRSILQSMLDQLDLAYSMGVVEASIYKMGLATSEKDGKSRPIIVRETDVEKARRVERTLGPRIDRLRRLIAKEKREGR